MKPVGNREFSLPGFSGFYRDAPELQCGPLIFQGSPTPLGRIVFKGWENYFSDNSLWFDAGGGTGEMSGYLSAKYNMTFITGDLCPPEPNTVMLDLLKLPFVSALFDGILISDVVEHIPDSYRLFVELHRVLKPGGKLVVFSPNYKNICGFLKRSLETVGLYPHNRFAPFRKWRCQYFEKYITITGTRKIISTLNMKIVHEQTYWKFDGWFPFIYLLPDYFLHNPVTTILRKLFDVVPGKSGLYFDLVAIKDGQ